MSIYASTGMNTQKTTVWKYVGAQIVLDKTETES